MVCQNRHQVKAGSLLVFWRDARSTYGSLRISPEIKKCYSNTVVSFLRPIWWKAEIKNCQETKKEHTKKIDFGMCGNEGWKRQGRHWDGSQCNLLGDCKWKCICFKGWFSTEHQSKLLLALPSVQAHPLGAGLAIIEGEPQFLSQNLTYEGFFFWEGGGSFGN